jgi:alpha-D-xyloside xylohydrolase
LGYRLNLWEHLYTHPDSPLYPRVADKAGSFEVWNGAVPDLFVPEVAAAFAEHHRRSLGDADGFKLDECDNSDFVVYPWSFPEHSEFPSGLDGEQMHSLMGLRYQQLIAAIYRERNRRSYSQVRASHALAASSPFVLYSDLYGHEDFIRGLVNAGLSGLLWSPEVRVARSATDLLRRLQTVVFSPHALVNGWTLRHPPWRQWEKRKNRGDELMSDWEALEAESRFWFRLRMRFLPYLYAAFAEYRFAGTPPFRPLVSEYPDDPETYGIDDQYLMGPDLLVAPLTAASDTRRVYIPAGAWYEFWTGTRIEGPRRVDAEAQLPTATAPEIEVPDLPVGGRIPLYVRAGAILPLAAPEPRVAADTQFRITAWCYGTPCRDSYLFEDDGESFDFESGVYNRLRLRWEPGTSRGPVLERESAGPRAYAGKRYVLEGYQVL